MALWLSAPLNCSQPQQGNCENSDTIVSYCYKHQNASLSLTRYLKRTSFNFLGFQKLIFLRKESNFFSVWSNAYCVPTQDIFDNGDPKKRYSKVYSDLLLKSCRMADFSLKDLSVLSRPAFRYFLAVLNQWWLVFCRCAISFQDYTAGLILKQNCQ